MPARIVSITYGFISYVLLSSLLLVLLYWQWRPMPTVIWDVQNSVGHAALTTGHR